MRLSVSEEPSIGAKLLVIHAAISRGMRVCEEHGRRFSQQGFPAGTTRAGFISYVRTFVSVLDAHHLLEEEWAFPRLRDRFPDVRYDLLLAQHRVIIPLLDEIAAAIERLAGDSQAHEPLNQLTDASGRTARLWHPHRQLEEEHFSVVEAAARLRSGRNPGFGVGCHAPAQRPS